jgi:hypothetical protein
MQYTQIYCGDTRCDICLTSSKSSTWWWGGGGGWQNALYEDCRRWPVPDLRIIHSLDTTSNHVRIRIDFKLDLHLRPTNHSIHTWACAAKETSHANNTINIHPAKTVGMFSSRLNCQITNYTSIPSSSEQNTVSLDSEDLQYLSMWAWPTHMCTDIHGHYEKDM